MLGAAAPNTVALPRDDGGEGDADLANDAHGEEFAPNLAAEPKEGAPVDFDAGAAEKEKGVKELSVAWKEGGLPVNSNGMLAVMWMSV